MMELFEESAYLDFEEMCSTATHSQLLRLKEILDKEIRLSEIAIEEGFEEEV